MRIVLQNCSCDYCEEVFERTGWIFAGEDGRHLDFCSRACAAGWFRD
jgi:ribosomal protein L24E